MGEKHHQILRGPGDDLTFCASVADSEAAAHRYQMAGYDFRVVHYMQTADEKAEIIRGFRNGQHIGLISCVSLTKGFDVPGVKVMQDAYKLNKSLSMHLQKIGRVIRSAENKEFGLVIDHAGNWLGFLNATKAFFASGVPQFAKKRKKGEKENIRTPEEETKEMKCPSCGFIQERRPKVCPSCGYERVREEQVIEDRDGILTEIDEITGEVGHFEGDWWEEISRFACQSYPNDFIKAKKKAFGVYYGIFGVWPEAQFRIDHAEPDPVVADICKDAVKRWKKGKRG